MLDCIDHTAPVRAGEELDHAAVTACLKERLGWEAPLEITQFPCGHSNLTYLIRSGNQELVLRRPPFGAGAAAHDMNREYTILSKLRPIYPPAPETFFYAPAGEVLDVSFYTMARVTGVVLRGERPEGFAADAATVRRYCQAFAEGLARIHGLDYRAVGLDALHRPGAFVARQVRNWIKRYEQARTDPIASFERAAAWLQAHCPEDVGAVLIHNDYRLENIVLDPTDLRRSIGVLDWELATIGDPLIDLGVALSYWEEPSDPEGVSLCFLSKEAGALSRRDFAEVYARKAGLEVSDLLFYYLFALFRWSVNVQQIYVRHLAGLTQDPRFARFDVMLRWIAERTEIALDSGEV